MFKPLAQSTDRAVRQLASGGYWAARAVVHLAEGRYSRAVEICREYLPANPDLISGRVILARALFHAGQIDSARRQFHELLARDPDNLVALKYLGDITYADGDETGAVALYERVLEIDPFCRGLCSPINRGRGETTRTITLKSAPERTGSGRLSTQLRQLPFLTETIGDLYLAQGYPRLAAEVFRSLSERSPNPRLAEKLSRAEQGLTDKDK